MSSSGDHQVTEVREPATLRLDSSFVADPSAPACGVLGGLDIAAFEDALGLAPTRSAGLVAAQDEAMTPQLRGLRSAPVRLDLRLDR